MQKTGIVIPCYNEENRLPQDAFIVFLKENPNYFICFVNDGSKDKTLSVLYDLQKMLPG